MVVPSEQCVYYVTMIHLGALPRGLFIELTAQSVSWTLQGTEAMCLDAISPHMLAKQVDLFGSGYRNMFVTLQIGTKIP